MSSVIRLIVGLGNPTTRYEGTRHNAGFWFVDAAARSLGVVLRPESRFMGVLGRRDEGGSALWLLKPTTYMNRSGHSVLAVAAYFKIAPSEILVAHDELDLDVGAIRLKKGGGHGGHNGLRDIVAQLGSSDFYRLRFGIGHPGDRSRVVGYVLDNPGRADRTLIDGCVERSVQELRALRSGEFAAVMNRLHADPARIEKKG